MALDLLKKKISPKEVVSSLEVEFELSARQAYRYLQQAQKTTKPLAVPEPKAVFTVKLPTSLIQRGRKADTEAGVNRSAIWSARHWKNG